MQSTISTLNFKGLNLLSSSEVAYLHWNRNLDVVKASKTKQCTTLLRSFHRGDTKTDTQSDDVKLHRKKLLGDYIKGPNTVAVVVWITVVVS